MAFVHELGHAIGLKHPFQSSPFSSATLQAQLDNFSFTVMSYNETVGVPLSPGMSIYPTTPMALDIAAAQYLYGPNLSYHAGNDVYSFSDSGRYFQTIWDAGGNDTIQYNASTGGVIDLRPDHWSALGQPIRYSDGTLDPYTVAIYNTVTIENAIGGSGSDTLIGNDAANQLSGRGGDDTLDGGTGIDTAAYNGAHSAYTIAWKDGATVSSAAEGTDHLSNIEALQFTDTTAHITTRPLDYIASYPDLMAVFGTGAAAGFDHYLNSGYNEGRSVTFDGLDYIASYGDLMNAFGASDDAGASHYIQAGRYEGRHITFDGLDYLASYTDLMNAFGADGDAGATHYIQAGRFEGRHPSFDALEYIASYGDLIMAFGNNVDPATSHYIDHGRFEGRLVTFDGLEYIASYPDLINAFHAQVAANPNPDIGATHYINAGYAEGRKVTFDGLEYIASYPDLINAFHAQVAANPNPDIGATHYIDSGYAQHRATALFNAAQYLANYSDLQAAFGTNTEAATIHYITHGYFEHRTDHNI